MTIYIVDCDELVRKYFGNLILKNILPEKLLISNHVNRIVRPSYQFFSYELSYLMSHFQPIAVAKSASALKLIISSVLRPSISVLYWSSTRQRLLSGTRTSGLTSKKKISDIHHVSGPRKAGKFWSKILKDAK
ncbi:Uncharacterised protein at_DN2598 [Pycnogonum litorale]